MPRLFSAVLLLAPVFTGCKKPEQCAATDTPAVCKAFQECVKSDTSTEVCRMGEQDASQSRQNLAPAYNGSAAALKDSSSQKPAPQPPQKH